MIKEDYLLLEKILYTDTPSSMESEMGAIIKQYAGERLLFNSDAMGNYYLELNSGKGLPIMIAAHTDEIALQVVNIMDSGLLSFRMVGGVDVKSICGSRVKILTSHGKIPGVICKKPIHVEMIEKVYDKPLEFHNMWIDIGCSDRDEAAALVEIGDLISFDAPVTYLGQNRIAAKALDNKSSVYVLLKTMLRLQAGNDVSNNVVAVFTAQEEVGCKGATVAAERLRPNIGICLDVCVATDCPDSNADRYGIVKLGKGPVLEYTTDVNRMLLNDVVSHLSSKGLSFQKGVGLSCTGGTDTAKMQVSCTGIPCILLSIPLRSMHTTSEVCDCNDLDNTIEVLVELLKYLEGYAGVC